MELRIDQGSVWTFSPKRAGGANLILEPGETLSLSPKPSGFRVRSGVAWVSWRGEDIFLYPGEVIHFTRGGGAPVLSAARRIRLVLEFLS